jgi:hypothetical protein
VERTDSIFDETGVLASIDCASGLLSNLMPAGQLFFALEPDSKLVPMDWFDYATQALHEYLNRSNLHLQCLETLRSMPTFGTGCLAVKRGRRTPITYRDYTIGTYTFTEDEDGIPDSFHYSFQLTAAQTTQRSEELGWRIHPDIFKDAQDPTKCENMYAFVQVVEPRHSYNIDLVANTALPYSSTVVDVKHKQIVSEGGYGEMIHKVARWSKATDEVWGRGPGTMILPTVRHLQTLRRDLNEASNKHVNPPLEVVESGLAGKVKVYPGAVNKVMEQNTIRRLDIAGNYPVALEERAYLQEVVRKAYYLDAFRLFTEQRTQTKTAFESEQLRQEKLQRLSEPITRILKELMTPVIERTLNMMLSLEMLAKPPVSAQGMGYTIEYLGELALAQRNNQALAFLRWTEAGIYMQQGRPDILDNVEFDLGYRQLGRALGVRYDVLRSENRRDAIREERERQLREQEQLQAAVMAAQASQAVPNLATKAEPGSLLEAGMKGAA